MALLFIAAETFLCLLLVNGTSVQALNSIYLIGVLAISYVWGLGLGLVSAVASAIAFDLFVTPPAWSLRPLTGTFLASIAIFVVVALLAGTTSALTRYLAAESDARTDADLSAHFADLLLRARDPKAVLPAAAGRLARAFGLSSVSIEPGFVTPDDAHTAFPPHEDGPRATLIVPATLEASTLRRLRDRTVPPLERLLQAARERGRRANTLQRDYEELRRIADEQVALRRLATLIARNAPPSDVFDAVAREMGQILHATHTVIARYDPDAKAVVTAGTWNYEKIVPSGSRWHLEEGTVSDLVCRTRAPGRIDTYQGDGRLAIRLRDRGVFSSVGCPIMVGSDLWGVAIASSSTPKPLPADTEARMLDFTELAATAIANAQNRSDLVASRARVVATADETRRRIERNLHDGTQQNLVSIKIQLRGIEADVPPELDQLRQRLADVGQRLENAVVELQEISRGLHPAILISGGLKAALATLARRSTVEVRLTVSGERGLPRHVQVSIYYIVAEALANAAKHAGASVVHVDLTANGDRILLSVCDDGVGGADPVRGSGLIGLIDRVDALGGRIKIESPVNGGTTLHVEIPREKAE